MEEVRLRIALDLVEPPFDGWLAFARLIQFVVRIVTGEHLTYEQIFPHLGEGKSVDPEVQFDLDMIRIKAWNSEVEAREQQRKKRDEATAEAFRRDAARREGSSKP